LPRAQAELTGEQCALPHESDRIFRLLKNERRRREYFDDYTLRGVCPSCNSRRMANTAARSIDHVIAPDLTLRHPPKCEVLGQRPSFVQQVTPATGPASTFPA
jgi:hypothetical protein